MAFYDCLQSAQKLIYSCLFLSLSPSLFGTDFYLNSPFQYNP